MNQEATTLPVLYSMPDTLDTFMASFDHVISNLSGDDDDAVLGFVIQLCGVYSAHAMLSLDNAVAIRAIVFENAALRDFVLSLKFVFFSRWIQGRGKQLIEALVDDLVLGLSYDCGLLNDSEKENSLNVIPSQVTEALTSYEDGIQTLNANPWIICLLLIQIAVNLDDFTDKKSKGKK